MLTGTPNSHGFAKKYSVQGLLAYPQELGDSQIGLITVTINHVGNSPRIRTEAWNVSTMRSEKGLQLQPAWQLPHLLSPAWGKPIAGHTLQWEREHEDPHLTQYPKLEVYIPASEARRANTAIFAHRAMGLFRVLSLGFRG